MKKVSKDLFSLDAATLPVELGKITKNSVVTHGSYLVSSTGNAADHAWNHMDQAHRPWIHNTYTEALRIARGKNFAVSLTRFKFAFFKFSILVTDVQVSESLCYQSYSLFNMIYVHNLTHNLDKKIHIEWYLVSNRFLKFLHPILHWRLERLSHVQIAEDVKIIQQRNLLREKGYKFDTDVPDYLNSNTADNGVVAPPLNKVVSLDLSQLEEGKATKLTSDSVMLLVEKKGNLFSVWPAVCPHQGAPLSAANKCGKKLQCEWHGYKISSVVLSNSQPIALLGSLELKLLGNSLVVSQGQQSLNSPVEYAEFLAA